MPKHDCRTNWNKSAKAMEANIAVQLHREAKDHGLKFQVVIGDEDSTAIKHIRDEVDTNVEKYSDIRHIKRTLTH